MTIDTSREAINRMTGMWGVGVEPNMARVTEVLTALASERDEALAQVAALREAYRKFVAAQKAYDAAIGKGASVEYQSLRASVGTKERLFAALASIPDAAASRGVALVERGRLAGIKAAHADLLARGMNTSALVVACLLPDDDAPGGAVSEYERGRREGIEEARMAAYDLARDYAGCDDEAEAVALEKLAFQLKRALATPPADGGTDA
jgi:hypothetical protein